jgi:hypothetical protein
MLDNAPYVNGGVQDVIRILRRWRPQATRCQALRSDAGSCTALSDEPTILAQTTQLLFPIEPVQACIEVKTTLRSGDLTDCLDKSVTLRKLEPVAGWERPLFVVVAYNLGVPPKTVATALANAQHPPDLMCVLQTAMIAELGHDPACGLCLLQDIDDDGNWNGGHVAGDTALNSAARQRREGAGERRDLVLGGQRAPAGAPVRIEAGRVDDGGHPARQPLGHDELEDLEGVAAGALVALARAHDGAQPIRRDDVTAVELLTGPPRLASRGGADENDQAGTGQPQLGGA